MSIVSIWFGNAYTFHIKITFKIKETLKLKKKKKSLGCKRHRYLSEQIS